MALQPSGLITLSDIQDEFGGANPIGLSEYYRGGAYTTDNNTNVPTSGAISVSNFYGAVRQFAFTISTTTQNANLATLATSAGWDGSAPLVVTVDNNVWLWSDSTSLGGLIIPASITSGITLINNGYIIGKGGDGGANGNAGAAGGPAIVNSASNVFITNLSGAYIAGGGGGGGASAANGGGGGAGGGKGGNSNGRHKTCIGGAGGAIGLAGQNGESWGAPYTDDNYCGSDGGTGDPIGFGGGAGGGGAAGIDTGSSCGVYGGAGGGGGRILGAGATGGLGGNRGGPYRSSEREGGDGGANGGVGDNGINVYGLERGAGGGGGWGAAGGIGVSGIAGGAGGAAVSGTSVTLTNSGTIYGAVA